MYAKRMRGPASGPGMVQVRRRSPGIDRALPWLVLLAGMVLTARAQATILVFDQSRSSVVEPTVAGASVPQDYGDRVSGSPMSVTGGQFTYGNGGEGFTPNVTVDYASGNAVSLWTSQYGDLVNVLFANSNSTSPANRLDVLLTADPGYQVQLHHFDLAGYPGSDYTINGVSIIGDGATLFAQSGVLVAGDSSGPGHTAFDFVTPLTATALLIRIDMGNLAAGIQDNIGMDNIRFGQVPPPLVIPLPATGILFGSSLAGLALLLRRRPAGPADAGRSVKRQV